MQTNRLGKDAGACVFTVLGVLLIGIAVLGQAGPVMAAILVDPNANDISPAYDGVSIPWTISGDLIVGDVNDGRLTITNGSRVTDANAYLGYQAGSTGEVLVTGLTTQWLNSGGLYLGGNATQAGGTALLTISSGGVVEAADVILWSDATLAGNGTLKADSVLNYGTIRPGNDGIGTLNIEGDVTFWVNSVLEVEVDNLGNSDRLHVVGDVNIVGGTVRAISTETIIGNKAYTILDATKVTGRFDALDTALLDVTMVGDPNNNLNYPANEVLLTITASPFDMDVGLTPNQRAVAVALQQIADAGGNEITTALQQVPTLDLVQDAYNQLSGQSRPPLAPIAVTDSTRLMGIISNRLRGARGGVAGGLESLSDAPLLAMDMSNWIRTPGISDARSDGFLWSVGRDTPKMSEQEWGTWGKLYGLYGDRETDGGIAGYSYDIFGQSFGIDFQFSDYFVGGVLGGHSTGDVVYGGLLDKTDLAATHIGLYGSYTATGWYLNSAMIYSWLNFDTRRVVGVIGEEHTGSFDGQELSGYVEVGFDWQPAPTWLVQPLASLQVSFVHLDDYLENGLVSPLAFEEQDYESYKAALGAKVSKELLLGPEGYPAIFQARAQWVHEFGDTLSSVEARFWGTPSVSWTVTDAEVSSDSILLGAGAGVRLAPGLRAFVDYDTSFNSDKTIHLISGAVEYRW